MRCTWPQARGPLRDAPDVVGSKVWTVYEMATAGSPGRDTNTGHIVESYESILKDGSGFIYESILEYVAAVFIVLPCRH